jgi:hypothetical protein
VKGRALETLGCQDPDPRGGDNLTKSDGRRRRKLPAVLFRFGLYSVAVAILRQFNIGETHEVPQCLVRVENSVPCHWICPWISYHLSGTCAVLSNFRQELEELRSLFRLFLSTMRFAQRICDLPSWSRTPCEPQDDLGCSAALPYLRHPLPLSMRARALPRPAPLSKGMITVWSSRGGSHAMGDVGRRERARTAASVWRISAAASMISPTFSGFTPAIPQLS